MDGETSWREQRSEAVHAHADALARRKEAETRQARAIVADFVASMLERGVPARPLRARAAEGKATYRTHVVGWYVRRNHSLAVSRDGEFYVMDVPASLRSRLFGAQVAASDPPLVVGAGGRDGESLPLQRLLGQRLEAGHDFP